MAEAAWGGAGKEGGDAEGRPRRGCRSGCSRMKAAAPGKHAALAAPAPLAAFIHRPPLPGDETLRSALGAAFLAVAVTAAVEH